jgi:WD40 repeat protein
MPKESNSIVTCSTYGELMIHKRNGDQLQSKTLLSNPIYDFRDILVDDEVIYSISRNGHLAIIDHGAAQILDLSKLTHPSAISEMDKDNLLLIGDHGIAQYNKKKKMITAYKELDFKVISSSRYDYKPLLFDDQGRQHQVQDINKLVTTNIPVRGKVTAFASSKNTKQRVYGMSDGTIYLFDEKSGKISKLDGHLSRISKLKMNGNKLYSSSYDGTMKLWNTNSDKIEPMTLITTGSWIMNFIFDGSKQYVWMGDQNGVLTMALISVPMMVDRISNKLKRDFTVEEWNYYIGRKIPFESFMSQKGKEAKQ